MSIMDRIEYQSPQLSNSERKVSNLILTHPQFVETYTISNLAEEADTSTSAVLRFCKSLGYQGYKEFRFAMIDFLKHQRNQVVQDDQSKMISFLDKYQTQLSLLKQVDTKQLDQLASTLLSSSMNLVLGIHYSGIPAKQLSFGLADLGIVSIYSDDYIHASHLARTLDSKAALIYFSLRGNHSTYPHFLVENMDSKLENSFLITMNPQAALKQYFTHTFVLPGIALDLEFPVDLQSIPSLFVELVLSYIHDHY